MAVGVDLVAWQLELARGTLKLVDQSAIRAEGHAIECRICAENPARNFLPSPGRLEKFRLPEETPKRRIDTGLREGDEITPFYDPMIAKLIVHAETREQAIDQIVEALAATEIVGPQTNTTFLQQAIASAEFRAGHISTSFIERYRADLLAIART
jgi:3-methylcrotonyl-CoA carboxylase alpha subunit